MTDLETLQPGTVVRWAHTTRNGAVTSVMGKVLKLVEKDSLTPRPPCACRGCQKYNKGGYVAEDSVLVEVQQFGDRGQKCRSHYYLPRLAQIQVVP